MATAAPTLQFKDISVKGVKVLDEELGIVEAYVAGIGNKDSVGDIIQPGAFADSLDMLKPKGVWSHDWSRPVSKTLEIYEVDAGDSRLPTRMKTAGIGGLYVKTQFNLDTQDGRDAFSWVKFFDDSSEWSIGYQTLEEEYDKKAKANLLHKVKLFEYSPVLFGANPLTATVGVKVNVVSKGEENDVKIQIEGLPEGEQKDAITAVLEAAVKAELADTPDVEEVDDAEVTEPVEGEKTAEVIEEEASSADEVDEEEGAPEGSGDKSAEETEEVETTDEVEEEETTDEEVEPVVEETTDDADGEKALSPVVESFMTYAGKAEFTEAEAKALTKFVSERVEVKAVEGSVEQRLRKLDDALRENFEEPNGYVYLYATFDSTIVFYKSTYSEEGYESGFYETSYSIGDDGVEFGEAKEVAVVEVVVAKHAVMDAAFKGHTAGVKSILSPLVDASEGTEGDTEVKQAILDGIEAKSGAKLSKANRGLIESAIESLSKVIDAASDEDTSEKTGEEEEDLEVKDAEEESSDKDETAGQDEETDEIKTLTVSEDELAELQQLASKYIETDNDQ